MSKIIAFALAVSVSAVTFADDKKPAKIPHEAMLEIEAEHRAATLLRYGVSAADLSAGKVKIAEDGTITREPAKK